MKRLITLSVALCMCFVVAGCGKKAAEKAEKPEVQQEQQRPIQPAQEVAVKKQCVVVRSMWASTNKTNMDMLVKNLNNQEAIKKMYSMQAVFILKEGMEGTIEQTDGGLVEMRPTDKNFTIWTFKEAVKEVLASEIKQQAPVMAQVPAANNAQVTAAQGEIYVTLRGCLAAPSKKNIDMVADNVNDPDVVNRLIAMQAVMPLKEGMELTLVEQQGQVMSVKPAGRDYILWVMSSGVKKK